ncbi:glycosyltransferase family 2 protein [Acidisoma cellulosilytica]|uniref:Glycosyltransferase family 2 protein n=1 Tax=Acidisoma cellulosilyticum TaxID=2802395 RepID=A0A964E532_9PROT|nr:glycosyltransferase family A protein [Acidisoma cellulosilyticum]MCB8882089.1 glycosyltransferase family 2 protein [Acidisoma cellulosilyticum]
MRFSLIMVTGGRTTEVAEFMESLAAQSFQDFELIIVQQNADDRLARIIAAFAGRFPLQVIRSLPRQINHSRNVGTAQAQGEILAFPDDDCLYPPDLLCQVDEMFNTAGSVGIDILSGIAVTPDGKLGSGRWHKQAGPISLKTVWTSAIEFNLFIRRTVYEEIGGFDKGMGLGTPFASGDAQDLILLARRIGALAFYDPALQAIHPDKRLTPVAVQRAFVYGAGLGYVLRKHRVPMSIWINFLIRPFGGTLLSLLRLRFFEAGYYWLTFRGRLSGLIGPQAKKVTKIAMLPDGDGPLPNLHTVR